MSNNELSYWHFALALNNLNMGTEIGILFNGSKCKPWCTWIYYLHSHIECGVWWIRDHMKESCLSVILMNHPRLDNFPLVLHNSIMILKPWFLVNITYKYVILISCTLSYVSYGCSIPHWLAITHLIVFSSFSDSGADLGSNPPAP